MSGISLPEEKETEKRYGRVESGGKESKKIRLAPVSGGGSGIDTRNRMTCGKKLCGKWNGIYRCGEPVLCTSGNRSNRGFRWGSFLCNRTGNGRDLYLFQWNSGSNRQWGILSDNPHEYDGLYERTGF